jgi:hypothetical protein
MTAGEDALPVGPARSQETAAARRADRRQPGLGITVPVMEDRWYIALKWGRDRRARPERDELPPPPPTVVEHPLSRLGLVAISTSLAIIAACLFILVYALVLE